MKNKNTKIGAVIGVVVLVVLLVLILRGGATKKTSDISEVKINRGGEEIVVRKNGRVDYISGDNTYIDFWSEDKINAYFGYFDKYYLLNESDLLRAGDDSITINVNGETKTYVLSSDEEIDDAAAEDAKDDDSGSGGGGDNIGDYFTNGPTPTPNPSSSPGGSTGPTPTPTPPNGGDPECLYWRLSYCVRKRTPSPTPTPTGTAQIRPDNCESNTQTGKTVISNELCIPTPTP